jgi:hypothetical protein
MADRLSRRGCELKSPNLIRGWTLIVGVGSELSPGVKPFVEGRNHSWGRILAIARVRTFTGGLIFVTAGLWMPVRRSDVQSGSRIHSGIGFVLVLSRVGVYLGVGFMMF